MLHGTRIFAKLEYESFSLSTDTVNKWFLTKSNEIIAMKYALNRNGFIEINGGSLKHINSFFETPIRSTNLNIYRSNCSEKLAEYYKVSDIKCKMVAVPCTESSDTVFIPLVHTL